MKSVPIAIALTAFVFGFGGWYLHDRFGDRHEMPPPAPKPPPTTAPDDNTARFADTLQPVGNGEWSIGTVAPLAAAEPNSAPPGATNHSAALPAAGSRLAAYPLATRSWGDIYNPGGSTPAHGFAAWFIDTRQPQQPVATAEEARIALNFAYSDSHGIPSESFAAYWAGKIPVVQKGHYRLKADISWAQMRVLLDRHIIAESREPNHTELPPALELEAGEHLLEVEYNNHWHTAQFQLALEPDVPAYGSEDLAAAIAALHLPPTTVTHVVALYQSAEADKRVRVQAPAGDTPYILVLNSYEPVNWELQGRAPVLVVHDDRGSLHGTGGAPQLVWRSRFSHDASEDLPGPPECTCYIRKRNLKCKGDITPGLVGKVKQLTGYPLAGFSGAYDNKGDALIPVPLTPVAALAEKEDAAIKKIRHDIATNREHCAHKSGPYAHIPEKP